MVLLTGFLPISEAASIYSSIPPYAIGSVPSLSDLGVRSLRESAGIGPVALKVVPVTGAAFAGHHGPINVRLSFPTPTVGAKK